MKRIIYLLLLFPFICFGQAPQGVNYQAVAYDANGFELSNKEVGVRISIVEGSAFGTPQLVEEHDVITTEQGLFSITIGQGALLGGEVASLLDILWGSNTYFLKIELDVENNGSYMDFGTQQFMSVPYALYAESSGAVGPEGPEGPEGPQGEVGPQGEPADPVDYDSLSNMISVDSTFLETVLAGIGVNDCDWQFPEGIDGVPLISQVSNANPYTVPDGYKLYILSWDGPSPIIEGHKCQIVKSMPLILNSGEILTNDGESSISGFGGLLIESNSDITAITIEITDLIPYQVPSGKRLVILNYENGTIRLTDSFNFANSPTNGLPIILSSGTSIETNNNYNGVILNGYIVDENYFANCGGSSSSNETSSADSMIVSDFGDTLTMNGQSIIVPGISIVNYIPTYGSVTDIDGNTYETTIINGKEWMIEDLLVTSFSNGDPLNQITGSNNWQSSTCNNIGYIINITESFGAKVFYNLHAINDSRGICPSGWRVATEQDYIEVLNIFDVMTSYGNGYGFCWENAGPALKKQDGGWSTVYYPAGQATNNSYLGFEGFGHSTCTNANSLSTINTEHRSWTGTPGGPNGGNWTLKIIPTQDLVTFEDASTSTMLPCRCVKD